MSAWGSCSGETVWDDIACCVFGDSSVCGDRTCGDVYEESLLPMLPLTVVLVEGEPVADDLPAAARTEGEVEPCAFHTRARVVFAAASATAWSDAAEDVVGMRASMVCTPSPLASKGDSAGTRVAGCASSAAWESMDAGDAAASGMTP